MVENLVEDRLLMEELVAALMEVMELTQLVLEWLIQVEAVVELVQVDVL